MQVESGLGGAKMANEKEEEIGGEGKREKERDREREGERENVPFWSTTRGWIWVRKSRRKANLCIVAEESAEDSSVHFAGVCAIFIAHDAVSRGGLGLVYRDTIEYIPES
jgi:hypothetical protein